MKNTLHGLPRALPPLSMMLAALGQPTAAQVGTALCVHPRTVRRWIACDGAPRPVLLSLFWLTHWGQSAVESAAINHARASAAAALCALDAARTAQKQNAHLMRVGEFGAANAPLAACD